jgi:hypothetical protein
VLAARRHRHDKVSVCGYLADVYCLGVKTALGRRGNYDYVMVAGQDSSQRASGVASCTAVASSRKSASDALPVISSTAPSSSVTHAGSSRRAG